MEFPLTRVGIFAATRWECRAVQRTLRVAEIRRHAGSRYVIGQRGACHVVLVQTGIGPQYARAACRATFREFALDLAVSSGLACALTPSSIGELFIGTEVIPPRSAGPAEWHPSIICDCMSASMTLTLAQAAGLPARTGRFVSLPRIVWRAEDKRRVAADTGAVALDMESAVIGAEAAERRIPFAVIRAVSDLLDEDLPLDFNLFLTPSDWSKGVWSCLTRPSNLFGLGRMRVQMGVASKRLTLIFERVLDELGCDRSTSHDRRMMP